MGDKCDDNFCVATSSELARTAADRWNDQYGRAGRWRGLGCESTHLRLLALGADPTPEQIAEVIGSDSWTTITCTVCGKHVDRAMSFDSGDGVAINVCKACLSDGLEAVGNV